MATHACKRGKTNGGEKKPGGVSALGLWVAGAGQAGPCHAITIVPRYFECTALMSAILPEAWHTSQVSTLPMAVERG